jgi:hypothetical protein
MRRRSVAQAVMRSLLVSPFVEMPIARQLVASVAVTPKRWPLQSAKADMQMGSPWVVTRKVAQQAVPRTWPSPSAAAR